MKKKRILSILLTLTLVMTMAVTVYASYATGYFNTTLPANQGDTEVSTVAKGTKDNYFQVYVSFSSGSYDAVRAWTESSFWKENYSNPYKIVRANEKTKVSYYSDNIPSVGANVILNLDNPVYTSNAPKVNGNWTPR